MKMKNNKFVNGLTVLDLIDLLFFYIRNTVKNR